MSYRRILIGVLLGAVVSLTLASGSSATAEEKRTWTDRQGRTLDQAEFVRIHRGVVILKRFNRIHKIPYWQFSDADQLYIRKELTAQGKANLIPKESDKPKGRRGADPGLDDPPLEEPPLPTGDPGPDDASPADLLDPGQPRDDPLGPGPGPDPAELPETTPEDPIAGGFDDPGDPSSASPPRASRPSSGTTGPSTKTVKEFRCSSCKKIVSADSQAGQTCPHCGVQWEFDEEEEDRIGSETNASPARWVWGGVMGALIAVCLVFAIRAFTHG